MGSLVLVVTRACNQRCAYCSTVKEGWPSLTEADVRIAISLFARQYGGGDIKLFGGEPLLVPDVVRAAFDAARSEPSVRRVYLSTNGIGLDSSWLSWLRAQPKAILTISLDGRPEDHRHLRRVQSGVVEPYDHVVSLLPELLTAPRLVVTQTIAPSTAASAAPNFRHLLSLGFRRFNLLPGYYLPWSEDHLAELRAGLSAIGDEIRRWWSGGRYLYLRNLFTRAPTPFFNTGLVVDSDRSIHPSNLGLSGALDELRECTRVGSLDEPPSADALAAAAADVPALLAHHLPARVWASTLAVDSALTVFCRSLVRPFAAYRLDRTRRTDGGAAACGPACREAPDAAGLGRAEGAESVPPPPAGGAR